MVGIVSPAGLSVVRLPLSPFSAHFEVSQPKREMEFLKKLLRLLDLTVKKKNKQLSAELAALSNPFPNLKKEKTGVRESGGN